MVRALVFTLVLAGAHAQSLVDAARIPAGMKDFEKRADDRPLRCDVAPIRPLLNYNFRFGAGYIVRVPMQQFSGSGHRWSVLMRITPENGQPAYLAGRVRLPNIPPTKVLWETGGFYLLGEGRYQVAWKLVDDSGRVCRKEWKIEARLRHGEREVKTGMPPGTVADLSLRGVSLRSAKDDAAPIRLTILLHAAPVFPRRTRLGARDRFMLLSTLSSLLERVPAKSVRLVAFNLSQQKEIYRAADFSLSGMGALAQSLEGVQLETVDYQILRNRSGHVDLIADLVNREVTSETPSDVVVFLGPEAPFWDKMPRNGLQKPDSGGPKFFYLQYRFPIQQAVFADTITRAVAGMKGKTLVIRSPGEFAKAIEQIERR